MHMKNVTLDFRGQASFHWDHITSDNYMYQKEIRFIRSTSVIIEKNFLVVIYIKGDILLER